MTSQQLSNQATARLADVLPNARVAALDQHDPTLGRQAQLYRLRLLGGSFRDEVSAFGNTPEQALDKFEAAVRKSLQPKNPFA